MRAAAIGFVGYVAALVSVAAADSWSLWITLPLAIVSGYAVGYGLSADRF